MGQIFDSVYYPLWIAHPVMQVGLAALMIWRRKLLRTYPFFFAYIVSEVMLFLVLFLNERNPDVYFYLYWVGATISAVLGFKVIHEVFSDVLRPFHALRDFSSMLFRWAALVVMLIATMSAIASTRTDIGSVGVGLLSLDRSVRVMQCGLVLFLLMFSRYLGISWRHRSFGIALGFGIFAVVEFALLGLQFANVINRDTLNIFNMGAYDGAIVIWLVYALASTPKLTATPVLLQPQRWDLSLGELTQPLAPESLMPMFDAMVDRAFSKAEAAPKPAENVGAATDSEATSDQGQQPSGSPALIGARMAAAAHRGS